MSAVQWYDKRPVILLTTFVGVHPVGTISRYDKKAKEMITVPCSEIVKFYNRQMGYVDEFNRRTVLYRTSQHCLGRHYLRNFAYLLDAAIVNLWVQYTVDYQKAANQETKRLFEFNAEICNCL